MTKKEKIIKYALKEFAEKGFLAASTNTISKASKVSKGAIFYHFKNKENLYIECFKKIQGEYEKEFLKFYSKNTHLDFFEFLIKWSYKKIEIAKEKPEYLQFFKTVESIPESLKEKILKLNQEIYSKYIPFFFEKFEKLELKENMDKNFSFKITFEILEYLSKKYYYEFESNLEKIMEEIEKVINIIKFGILK